MSVLRATSEFPVGSANHRLEESLLGRGLPQTGRLSSEGVAEALTALRRYKAVLQGWDQAELFAAATAAVREAADGPEFLSRILKELSQKSGHP